MEKKKTAENRKHRRVRGGTYNLQQKLKLNKIQQLERKLWLSPAT